MSTSTTNATVSPAGLLGALRWRYATKKFDAAKKIPADLWATLEEALVLTASSFGLQPWRFVVVKDTATRAQLQGASWNQSQVVDASHLVVFAARKGLGSADVDRYMARTAEVRGVSVESLAGFRSMLDGFVKQLAPAAAEAWAARQAYIALGNFLTSCAVLGIDACPMEGFEPAKYDQILKLPEQGYTAVVVATAGYRAADDKYALLPKVRAPKSEVLSFA